MLFWKFWIVCRIACTLYSWCSAFEPSAMRDQAIPLSDWILYTLSASGLSWHHLELQSGHRLYLECSGLLHFWDSAFLCISLIFDIFLSLPVEHLIVLFWLLFELSDAESEVSSAAHFCLVDLFYFVLELSGLSLLGEIGTVLDVLIHFFDLS